MTKLNDFLEAKLWAAQSATNEKVGQFSESQILVCLYNLARTHFIRNS